MKIMINISGPFVKMTGQSLLFIFMIDLASFSLLADSKSDWGIPNSLQVAIQKE
nr:hypothetical protein [Akkermansia muciniphila]